MTDMQGAAAGAQTVAAVADPHAGDRVGWGFISLYATAYMGTVLLFLAPLLVSLSLKVTSLVGVDHAANSLSLVAGTGALLAMFANPFFGKLSDRTSSRLGMRRPWMIVGLAGGSLGVLLVALVAVLPDQVPVAQRGLVSGVLGVCLPIASVTGTFVVQLFTGNDLAMFLAPCAIGGLLVMLFVVTLKDRRLLPADKPAWSVGQLAGTFYVNPVLHRDFASLVTSTGVDTSGS